MLKFRLKRALNILLLIIIKNIVLLLILIYSPTVQSFVTKQIVSFVSSAYDIELEIGGFHIDLPNEIVLSDVKIFDSFGNALISTKEISTDFTNIRLLDKQINFEQISILDPLIDVFVDSSGNTNYNFILDKFKSTDTTSTSNEFRLACDDFQILNARFKYKNISGFDSSVDTTIFNPNDINIKNISLKINGILYEGDTLKLNLEKLNLSKDSGFGVELELSSKFELNDTSIGVYDFVFKTPNSEFISSNITVSGDSKDYLSGPLKQLQMNFNVDTLIFDVNDLNRFAPKYRNIHDKIHFSGKMGGNVSNIKFTDLNLSYGNQTRFNADLAINGLPDLETSFVFGDISKLNSSFSDINRIAKHIAADANFTLPDALSRLGDVSFKGNITGLFNDMVAYGRFNSNYGAIHMDLGLGIDFETRLISYDGQLKGIDVDLGKIIDDEKTLGKLNLNSEINGDIDSLGNFNAKIDCNISDFTALDYKYTGIDIEGEISNKFFDGEIAVNDPNLKVEIFGKYIHSGNNQDVKVSADVWADLNAINITKDSLDSKLRFVVSTELKGDLRKTPHGNIYLSNFNFTSKGNDLNLHLLNLTWNKNHEQEQQVTIESDYIDLLANGEFTTADLITAIRSKLSDYSPILFGEVSPPKLKNKLDFTLNLKQINQVTKIIMPELQVDQNVIIDGSFSGENSEFDINIAVPILNYDDIVQAHESKLEIKGFRDSLDILITAHKLGRKETSIFDDFILKLDIENDSTSVNVLWENIERNTNRGDIKISSKLIASEDSEIPRVESVIHDSEIHTSVDALKISRTPISIDNREIHIDNFNFSHHNNSSLKIDGYISPDETKEIEIMIKDVDVSRFNSYLEDVGFELNGNLSGGGKISNLYAMPSFESELSIDSLFINDEDFDKLELFANWDGKTKGFNINGINKYMKIDGSYTPKVDSLNLAFTTNEFKLDVLESYLTDYDLSGTTGLVDIVLNMQGGIAKPDISGFIDFKNTSFTYDMLKAKINFEDTVYITNDAIEFRDFIIFDDDYNFGYINGGITHNYFSDIKFDATLESQGMHLLNTTEKDNSLYYGSVFGTGTVAFTGNLRSFGIDVVAKTEPNSVFVLPMTSSYESNNISYVTFIKPKVDTLVDETKDDIIPQVASRTRYYINLDIEVTPEAEAQIVFDPMTGNMLKGNAKGDLKIEVNSDDEFNMYGELEVEDGDYLFTLENIINKKFDIRSGGTITWSGDAEDAVLDLVATYSLHAPLTDLMASVADSSDNYNKHTSVDCNMHITGNLMSPDIKFGIEIPKGNNNVQAQLATLSQDEINKQLLYLLILNRFSNPDQTNLTSGVGNTTDVFGVTSSEILSNQLSNWLSQISKDFDIGINYRAGVDQVSEQELEVAMSTQLFNDRILIDGNVDFGERNTSTSSIVGDIEVQLKVNESGSFRLKGYTKANDDIEAEFGPYTSGVGVFYTEDFDTLRELFTKFWHKMSFYNKRMERKYFD